MTTCEKKQPMKIFFPPHFNPHQFACGANRSAEDVSSAACHTALSPLEKPGSSVRMLLIDYSSAFNTVMLGTLVDKLYNLDFPLSICAWIRDILTDRPQTVKIGPHNTLSTGSPQGCLLPVFYALYTALPSTLPMQSSPDGFGLVNVGDESPYRYKVCKLSKWFKENDKALDSSQTKEMILDVRRHRVDFKLLLINGDVVERSLSFIIPPGQPTQQQWLKSFRLHCTF